MASTTYYWDEVDDNLISEEDENGNTTAEYQHEPGPYGELISQHRDGQAYCYHYDGGSNAVAVTDENENVAEETTYSAFGEVVSNTSNITNPFGYKGALGYYANGATQDVYVRARLYSPAIGRWLVTDPLGFADAPNRYVYVGNDPIGNVDPSGLELIKFRFAAFIHGNRGRWLWEPFSRFYQFKTDVRGFGEVGTSRIRSDGVIDSCDIGRKAPTGKNAAGLSHRRGFLPSEKPRQFRWQVFAPKRTLLAPNIVRAPNPIHCHNSKIYFEAAGNYPYVASSPNIDYHVNFVFRIDGPDIVFVRSYGYHDSFPDYEVVVEVRGERHVLYKYYSPSAGPGIWNLGGGPERPFSSGKSFILKTPGCCPIAGTCPIGNDSGSPINEFEPDEP